MTTAPAPSTHRDTFVLADTGFNEVPPRLRRHYRHWGGAGDTLGPNEALCPVCHVVLRAEHTLLAGDELHCLPCMTGLLLVAGDDGRLVAEVKRP